MKVIIFLIGAILVNLGFAGMRAPNKTLPPPPVGLPSQATQVIETIVAQEAVCLGLVKEGRLQEAFDQLAIHNGGIENSDAIQRARKLFFHYACKWRRTEGAEISRNMGGLLRDQLVYELDIAKNPLREETDPKRTRNLELLMNVYADVLRKPQLAMDIARSLEITIRRNLIIDRTTEDLPFPITYGVQGIGFFDGFFEDCSFENNIIITDMWHGLTVIGAINCRIVNNTVVENPLDITARVPRISIENHKDGGASTGNLVYNNISSSLLMSGLMGEKDNNITGRAYDEIFVDYGSFDLRLKPDSAAIDAANTAYAPEDDYNGHMRDSRPDIGAIEYDAGVSALFPLAAYVSGFWYQIDWMGSGLFYAEYFPWIAHAELGWLWLGGAVPDAYWMYRPQSGWIYGYNQLPDVYYSADRESWIYHDPESGVFGEGCWFYDYAEGVWNP